MAKKITTPKELPLSVSNASEGASGARPLENFMAEVDVVESSSNDGAGPSNLPPGETAEIEEAFGASVWYNNKKIVGLWSDKGSRNSWANIQGMGWKKVSTANNSCSSSLTMLLSHARERNRMVRLQLDNNLISQVYAW